MKSNVFGRILTLALGAAFSGGVSQAGHFTNDFNFGLPAGAAVYGNAFVDATGGVGNSGALKLTLATGGQAGAMLLPDIDGGQLVGGLDVSFNVLISEWNWAVADGFSFCWAKNLPDGTWGEEGPGGITGLTVCFDTFDNGSGDDAPSLDVRWNGAQFLHTRFPSGFPNNGNWAPVRIQLTPEGKFSMTYDGNVVYADTALSNYTGLSGARYGFSGRTGGAWANQWIDNLSITTTPVSLSRPVNPTLSYDFNSGLPASTITYGSAYVEATDGAGGSGVLKITRNLNGQSGTYVIPDVAAGQPSRGLDVAWRAKVGGGTTPPADGYSFNWASDLPDGPLDTAEEGAGTGLSVCFDLWDSGGGDDAPAIDIKWGGVQFAHKRVPFGLIDAWPEYVDVIVNVSTNGVLDMVCGPYLVYKGLQIPNFHSIAYGRFAFTGRTGGANMNAWVDDLAIRTHVTPALTLQPLNTRATAGQSATFTVTAVGTPPMTLQWYSNGVAIAGANSPSYTTQPATDANNGDVYHFEASNDFGVAVSSPALLITSPLLVTGVRSLLQDNQLLVQFSVPVEPVTALNPLHYGLNNGVSVLSAQFGADNSKVILSTTPMASGLYTLTVQNVQDGAAHTVYPSPTAWGFRFAPIGKFDFVVLPSGAQVFGSTSLDNGVLKLTTSALGQKGTFIAGDLGYGPTPISEFLVRFQASVGGGTAPPADGFCFSFAPDLVDGPWDNPPAEEGVGSGISVAFDTFDNGGGEGPAFDINVRGQRVFHSVVPVETFLSWPNWWDVTINLKPGGLLDVVYGSTVVCSNLDTGYTPMRGRFGFGGRTGGLTENVWFRNLTIAVGSNTGVPVIGVQPVAQSVWEGAPATFDVGVQGVPPFAYQWLSNGVPITGATTHDLPIPAVTRAMDGALASVRVVNDLGTTVSSGALLRVYSLSLAQEPQDTNIVELQSTTLRVVPGAVPPGSAPLLYQWQGADGLGGFTNMPGATAALYTTPRLSTCLATPLEYQVVVTVPGVGNSVTSRVVSITLTPDNEAPRIVSVGSLDGSSIVLQFSEPIFTPNAEESLNFAIDGFLPYITGLRTNIVNGVTNLVSDQVVLYPDPANPAILDGYQVTADNMRDLSCQGNQDSSGPVAGRIERLIALDIGVTDPAAVPGSAWSAAPGSLDAIGLGGDIWNNSDNFHFDFRPVTGNFDVSVRLGSLVHAADWSKAGLMARLSTNANSPNIALLATPGLEGNGYAFQWRDYDSAPTASTTKYSVPAPPAIQPAYPNAWMRLQRLGSLFNSYVSTNGSNWVLFASRDTAAVSGGAYPATLLLGLATAGNTGNPARTTLAEYRDLHFPLPPVITLQPSPDTQTVALHSPVSYAVAASSPSQSGPLTYQWLLNDKPLPGATTALLILPNASAANSGVYTVLALNDGGASASQPVTLSVPNLPPESSLAALLPTECAFSITAPALLAQAGATDPEHDPVSLYAVSGLPPVLYTADFNSGLPAGAAVFGTAFVDIGGGVDNSGCVKLTTTATGQAGSLIVSDLASGKAVSGFQASFKVLLTQGSGNPADGFSFSFARDLPDNTWGEDGAGTGLTIGFDNYDNGTGGVPSLPVEAPAIDVFWGGQAQANLIGHVMVPKIQSSRWLQVEIQLSPDGKLDVRFDGTNVFTGLAVPYVPIAGGRFGVSARTGGEVETHWVDDLSINVLTTETAAGGRVTLDAPNGTVHYTGPSPVCGIDTFYFVMTDGQVNGLAVGAASLNHPPEPRADQMQASSGAPSSMALAKMLANDRHLDADVPVMTSFTQPAHGTVVITSDTVTYTSQAAYEGPDSWTYTLTDAQGAAATATVSVKVIPALKGPTANIVASGIADGYFWARFAGIPGHTYRVESTVNVATGPWEVVQTATAARSGLLQVTDFVHNPADGQRFYRAVVP